MKQVLEQNLQEVSHCNEGMKIKQLKKAIITPKFKFNLRIFLKLRIIRSNINISTQNYFWLHQISCCRFVFSNTIHYKYTQ